MTDELDLRKGFHGELELIRSGITHLAASVIEAIPRATQVLLDNDLEGADYLLLADQDIDSRSLELEERCYQVLALQAPVASDLRQVMAAVKMISEIERSGDLCVNVCKAARRIYGAELDPQSTRRCLDSRWTGVVPHRLLTRARLDTEMHGGSMARMPPVANPEDERTENYVTGRFG